MAHIKKNGFIVFAEEKQIELEGEGITFPNGIRDVIRVVSDLWDELSPQERASYQFIAKTLRGQECNGTPGPTTPLRHEIPYKTPNPDYSAQIPIDLMYDFDVLKEDPNDANYFPGTGKTTTFGFKTGDIHGISRYKRMLSQRVRSDILRLLDSDVGLPGENEFIIIHCTSYTEPLSEVFLPGEIGMVAFSLNHGIVDSYASLIDPASMPVGRQLEVQEASERYGIPVPPYHKKCQNYAKILEDIAAFFALHPTHSQIHPMIFGLRNNTATIFATMQWLSENAGVEMLKFQLRPLIFLFYQLTRVGTKAYEESEELKAELPVEDVWESLLPKVEVIRGVPWILNEGRPRARNFSSIMEARAEEVDSAIKSTTAEIRKLSINEVGTEEGPTPNGSVVTEEGPTPNGPVVTNFGQLSINEVETEDGHTPNGSVVTNSNSDYIFENSDSDGDGSDVESSESEMTSETGSLMTIAASRYGKYQRSRMASGIETEATDIENEEEIFVFERDSKIYLESMDLAFAHDIGCHHHMNNINGVPRCPLNLVTRYAWNILDAVMGFWKITPKQGMHYPLVDPEMEQKKRRIWLSSIWNKVGYKDLAGFDDSYYDVEKELSKKTDDSGASTNTDESK